MSKIIDIIELFDKVLGDKIEKIDLPPACFTVMRGEIIEFDDVKKSLTVKIPVLRSWLNPYATMQGGMITAAIDNVIGPLSLLIAPMNMTRSIESTFIKPITMDMEYIYVTASLGEQKRKRLIFGVTVKDKFEKIYAKAKVINWIIEK
jgi:acyl-coenzyme A thioesterase PaaI-like protein